MQNLNSEIGLVLNIVGFAEIDNYIIAFSCSNIVRLC